MAGVVNTTYTFTATDLVTSSKINNLIDETVFTSDAITGTTLEVTGAGKLRVGTGGITSNELGADSVATAKLADSSVSAAKIASGAITSGKLSTYGLKWDTDAANIGESVGAIEYSFQISPLRSVSGATRIDIGAQAGVSTSASIVRASGANGGFTITNTGSGTMNIINGNALINFVTYGVTAMTLSPTTATFPDTVVADTYVTSSDYRLKSNITPLDDQIDNIMALRPVSYDISGENRIGLIAHEVQDIFPEAVRGEKDAVKEDGTPDYQSIEYTALIPALIAVIQEQQRQIDELFASR